MNKYNYPCFFPNTAVVDLFCGAGGLTHGLLQSGLRVVSGIDNDIHCKYAYENNNAPSHFLMQDIVQTNANQLVQLFGKKKIRILVGCAPCQPFSKYSHSCKHKDDNKWRLLNDFARLISETKPEVISMENVPDLQEHQIYKDFLKCLSNNGYHISDESRRIVYCPEYGVPQNRKRLVLLASLIGPIQLIPPALQSRYPTVRDAIGNLLPISSGERSTTDALHKACKLSKINLERIRNSRPGGTWRDWPESLRTKCHLSQSGQSYPSVYGRMEWDQPSPTITTQFFGYGNGRFGHPDQDRGLSLREGALLQSFPDDYSFCSPEAPISIKTVGRMIGNAVPVKIGLVIGKSIIKHLKENIR